MQITSEKNLLREVPNGSSSTEGNLRQRTPEEIEKPVSIETSSPENIDSDPPGYIFTNRTPQVSKKILKIMSDESSLVDAYFSHQSWKNVTLDKLSVIEKLVLNDKNLTQLHPKDFQGLSRVQQIDLTGTRICVLPENIFRAVPSLKHLLVNPRFSEEIKVKLISEHPSLSIEVKENRNRDWVFFNPNEPRTKIANVAGWAMGIMTVISYLGYAYSCRESGPEDVSTEPLISPFLLALFVFTASFFTVAETQSALRIDHKLPKKPTENTPDISLEE